MEPSPSAHEGKTLLVAILHGVGADAASTAPIATFMAEHLPQAAFFVPDGTHPFDSAPFDRQWFSLAGITETNRYDRVRQARQDVVGLIDQELNRRHLSWRQLAVMGFSQGAIMALSLLGLDEPPLAIASLSGRLASDIGPNAARSHVLLSHGTADSVIPFGHSREAAERLTAAGVATKLFPIPGQAHTIGGPQLVETARFIGEAVAQSEPVRA